MGVLAAFRRLRAPAALGLVLYALVLAATPVLHHDLACHLKTPTHCDACAMSPVASRIESSIASALPRLTAAGLVEALYEHAPRARVAGAQSDRAPPSSL